MPLARIITRSAEQAQELAGQLRARGYSVEIVSPEQVLNTVADVEMRLDECSVEEALRNAGLLAEKNLPVFIAPGAIADSTPLVQIPLLNQMEDKQQEELARDKIAFLADTQIDQTNPVSAEKLADVADGERSATEPAAEPRNEPEVYVYQDAMLSPLQRLRMPRIRLPRISWPRLRLPHLTLPRPTFRWPRVRVQLPKFSFHLPKIGLGIPKPHLRRPRFSWPHPSFRLPRIKVRLPETSRHFPSVALRVPRVNWQRVNWRIPEVMRSRPKKSSPWRHATPVSPSPISAAFRRRANQLRRMPSNRVFWDSAVAFAILAVSVLMVGGLLHSRTPLPASLTQQSENTGQQVPFAPVKRGSPSSSAYTKSRAIADQTVKATPLATPALAGERKSSPQITPPAGKVSHRRPSSQKPAAGSVKLAQKSRPTVEDDDYVADDVVIHYGPKN